MKMWGTWVAQLVKHLTLDIGSGHNLIVCEIEPHVGLHTDNAQPAWDSLSFSLNLTPACACSLSFKINIFFFLNVSTILNISLEDLLRWKVRPSEEKSSNPNPTG